MQSTDCAVRTYTLPLNNIDIAYVKRLQSIMSRILKFNHIIHVQ